MEAVFDWIGKLAILVFIFVITILALIGREWLMGDFLNSRMKDCWQTKLAAWMYHRIGDPRICPRCATCGGRVVVIQKGFGRWRKTTSICGCGPDKW